MFGDFVLGFPRCGADLGSLLLSQRDSFFNRNQHRIMIIPAGLKTKRNHICFDTESTRSLGDVHAFAMNDYNAISPGISHLLIMRSPPDIARLVVPVIVRVPIERMLEAGPRADVSHKIIEAF